MVLSQSISQNKLGDKRFLLGEENRNKTITVEMLSFVKSGTKRTQNKAIDLMKAKESLVKEVLREIELCDVVKITPLNLSSMAFTKVLHIQVILKIIGREGRDVTLSCCRIDMLKKNQAPELNQAGIKICY